MVCERIEDEYGLTQVKVEELSGVGGEVDCDRISFGYIVCLVLRFIVPFVVCLIVCL